MLTAANANHKNGSELVQNRQRLRIICKATVEGFCKDLSSVDSRAIGRTVDEITRLRQQMIVNMLAIGDRLSKLRSAIGPERFSQFMKEILPTIGISRSTGYRWVGFSERLALIFPNPLIREHLMALTDGKGIVTTASREDKNDFAHLVLTPAAQAALTTLPPAPTTKSGRVESEHWVRQFIKATAKARAQVRVPGRNLTKDQESMIKNFKRFAAYYGSQAAEDLCGQLDKLLNRMVEAAHSMATDSRKSMEYA